VDAQFGTHTRDQKASKRGSAAIEVCCTTSTSGSGARLLRVTWFQPIGPYVVHTRASWGTPPTGKSVFVDGQLLSHIVDGKFVEEWVHWDTLGLLRQIGAVPAAK
jgi:hypothetical protein